MALRDLFKKKTAGGDESAKKSAQTAVPTPHEDHQHNWEYIGDFPVSEGLKNTAAGASGKSVKYVQMEKCKICGMSRAKQ